MEIIMASILILGGDGFLGWPTAMHLSRLGHDVTVVDNYLRRRMCQEYDVPMLYTVPTLTKRAQAWHEVTGFEIKVVIGDLTEPEFTRSLFTGDVPLRWCLPGSTYSPPSTVVHYAEQPSAPYSMIGYKQANQTIANNLIVTNNVMYAVRDYARDTHIIKLGTMGEYGTPNIDIEEGWIEISHKGRADRFLFPRAAGSIYHTTKIMDTDLLWFGVRMWDLAVTDLMQGPVYGISTPETEIDPRLRTFFNYDEIFGTILNRFVTQAVCGFPLSVYGQGGQTRGFLNINDTLQCITQAHDFPAKPGELRIFNQMTETFSANQLAEMVVQVGAKLGYSVEVAHIENPRKEREEHYYNPVVKGLLDLGLEPHYLTDDLLSSIFSSVARHKGNIQKDCFLRGIRWS